MQCQEMPMFEAMHVQNLSMDMNDYGEKLVKNSKQHTRHPTEELVSPHLPSSLETTGKFGASATPARQMAPTLLGLDLISENAKNMQLSEIVSDFKSASTRQKPAVDADGYNSVPKTTVPGSF